MVITARWSVRRAWARRCWPSACRACCRISTRTPRWRWRPCTASRARVRPEGQRHRPPFRAPHHSASSAAILGSVRGARVTPGAATLAHRGVLFLDEAPEFARPALEGLRQPLESGWASLDRSGWSGPLPARFQLVLAANPCPCGLRIGSGSGCSCAPAAVRRYAARLSGPLLDRIDIRLAVLRPSDGELLSTEPAEDSATVRERVAQREHGRRIDSRGCPTDSTPRSRRGSCGDAGHRIPTVPTSSATSTAGRPTCAARTASCGWPGPSPTSPAGPALAGTTSRWRAACEGRVRDGRHERPGRLHRARALRGAR